MADDVLADFLGWGGVESRQGFEGWAILLFDGRHSSLGSSEGRRRGPPSVSAKVLSGKRPFSRCSMARSRLKWPGEAGARADVGFGETFSMSLSREAESRRGRVAVEPPGERPYQIRSLG